MDFKGGQIFNPIEPWEKALDFLSNHGIIVKKFIHDAIKNGSVDLTHPDFFHKNKARIKYNGKWYAGLEALDQVHVPNYGAVSQNKSRIRAEIEKLLRQEVLSKVPEKQLDESYCINPLGAVISSEKVRLLLHWKGNDNYVRGGVKLQTVAAVQDRLYSIENAEVHDLSQAYYQFPQSEKSKKLTAFCFEAEYYVYNTLSFGPSCGPEICQGILQLPVLVARLRANPGADRLILHYYDDFFDDRSRNAQPSVEQVLKEFNVFINYKKTQKGGVVVFLGLLLDFLNKTIELKPEKKLEIQAKIQEVVRTPILENLQSLAGSLEFWAGVDHKKRSKIFHVIKEINSRTADQVEESVPLSKDLLGELEFWKIEGLKKTEMPAPQPWLWARTVASSDASSKRWAFKIDDKTCSGHFPEEFASEIIFVKEFFAFYKLVASLPAGSATVVLIDNEGVVKAYIKGRTLNVKAAVSLNKIFLCITQRNLHIDVQWVGTKWMADYGADPASRGKFRKPELFLEKLGVSRLVDFCDKPLWDVFGSKSTSTWAKVYTAMDELHDDEKQIKGLDPWRAVASHSARSEVRFILVPRRLFGSLLNILRHSKNGPTVLAVPSSFLEVVSNLMKVLEFRKLAKKNEKGIFEGRTREAWVLVKVEGI